MFKPDVYLRGENMAEYMRQVPGGGQPGGPDYTFRMGRYELTNAQFAAFCPANHAKSVGQNPKLESSVPAAFALSEFDQLPNEAILGDLRVTSIQRIQDCVNEPNTQLELGSPV